jgi:hypothetical protein
VRNVLKICNILNSNFKYVHTGNCRITADLLLVNTDKIVKWLPMFGRTRKPVRNAMTAVKLRRPTYPLVARLTFAWSNNHPLQNGKLQLGCQQRISVHRAVFSCSRHEHRRIGVDQGGTEGALKD